MPTRGRAEMKEVAMVLQPPGRRGAAAVARAAAGRGPRGSRQMKMDAR